MKVLFNFEIRMQNEHKSSGGRTVNLFWKSSYNLCVFIILFKDLKINVLRIFNFTPILITVKANLVKQQVGFVV